jgi:hypothetical protein
MIAKTLIGQPYKAGLACGESTLVATAERRVELERGDGAWSFFLVIERSILHYDFYRTTQVILRRMCQLAVLRVNTYQKQ